MNEDILGHLIQVENDAANVLFDAQVEADKRISEARLQADSEFKSQYDALIVRLEKLSEEKMAELVAEHKDIFENFKSDLLKTKKNFGAFNLLMEKLLFGE